MAAQLEDIVLDGGLTILDTVTHTIAVCSSEPTTYTLASTGPNQLGLKSFGVGSAFGAPSAVGTPSSMRQVASVAVSDGAIVTSGTASWWAAYGTGTLHAHGTLSGAQVVTSGNSFTLAQFTIAIPNR